MPLETNLNSSPYFDDFDTSKGYYRYLHKPGVFVQTRELTGVQSMQQAQIEKFGKNIFVDGSVVDGCKLSFNSAPPYVKILDNYANGTALSITDLQNMYIQSNNGLRAYVFNTQAGLVSQSPNLNTLYLSYLNSSNDTTIKVFQPDEILTVYNSSNSVIGQITVANSISSGTSNTTGFGYSVTVDSGVIFQKGFFIDVSKQSLIVTPYSNAPDGVSVGFNTVESIVTSDVDSSLLDNSAGSPNYAAPGADRLKLTPTLVVRQSNSTANTANFFSLVDFVEGNPSIVRTDSTYNVLGAEMARRTEENSGGYIIEPFNIRCLTKYTNTNTIDTNYVKLEVDAGLAYVNGYRVKTVGKLVSQIRKGNDIRQVTSQIATILQGNYAMVNEFAGIIDSTALTSVSLRSATAQAITTGLSNGTAVNSIAAPGTEIGTADVLAVEYDSGTLGTPTGQFRVYLFNIKMNSGQNFSSVRSIYALVGGNKGFADLILTGGNAVLNDNSLGSLLFPLSQKAVYTLKTAANTINSQFQFKQRTDVSFSSAGVASVTIPTYVGGTNQLTFGTGILDTVSERQFLVIADGTISTTNNAGTVTASANTTVTGSGTSFTTTYWVGGMMTLANSTYFETHRITAIANNTSLTLASNTTLNAASLAHQNTYVAGQPIPLDVSPANVNITSSTTFTVNLNMAFSGAFNGTVYYNILRTLASPSKKKLNNTVYIKIDCSAHPANSVGPWCLGLPDVLSVNHVWVGNQSYSNSNPDQTTLYSLDSGQNDYYYGLGVLRANGATLNANSRLLIEATVFTKDTSSGTGFFSIDSYPIDDTGATANTILTKNLPIYISPSTGAIYSLRNTLDFRQYTMNTIPLVANVSSAISNTLIINPANTLTFATDYIPVTDSTFSSDLKYYVGRYDKVGMTDKGTVLVSEGTPNENPVPPMDIPNAMTLATVYVPPYPTLTNDQASGAVPADALLSLTYKKNKRYTMADIGHLDSRLSQVEYYTSLNLLEQSAQNLLILNSAGQNRFQNGILADPFNDFSLSNVTDTQFNIAIDSVSSEARPTFTQSMVKLKYAQVTGDNAFISNNGRLITTNSSVLPTPYISQPFASQTRNCSQDTMYHWIGHIDLTPDGDFQPDVTVNPSVVVNVNDGSVANWTALANAWGTQWGNWAETGQTTTYDVLNSSLNYFGMAWENTNLLNNPNDWYGAPTTANGTPIIYPASWPPGYGQQVGSTWVPPHQIYANNVTVAATTTTDYARYGTQLSVSPTTSQYNFGSYVTDISIQPFMRANYIKFHAYGMKPNTKLYAFFDDINVSNNCVMFSNPGAIQPLTMQNISASMITNANGEVWGVFYLQGGKFNAGERTFKLVDVTDLTIYKNSITTQATAVYHGTNLSYSKNNINLNTTTAQVSSTVVSQNTSTSSTQTSSFISEFFSGGDPLAQTFTINKEKFGSDDIAGVYIDRIGLFFASKHSYLGATVQIRNVVNGYPGPEVIPFAIKHLNPSDVLVSSDSSLETIVQFNAPVLLQSGQEYAIVIMPDGSNPGYNIWTAVIGGTDVLTQSPIYTNSSTGLMFTSSQNTAWTPYQTEDIKFNVYRRTFGATANVKLTNTDDEYLGVSILNGFALGETVYVSNSATVSANVANNSYTVTVNTTTFAANSKIYVYSAVNNLAFVANVNSITDATHLVINTYPTFTDANCVIGTLKGNGLLTGTAVVSNTTVLQLTNSTANSTVYFANGDFVIGGTISGATANATVFDIPYSVLMPKFAISTPNDTGIVFSFLGVANSTSSYAADATPVPLTFGVDHTFIDKERVVMSKSHEAQFIGGNKSLTITAALSTLTEKITPVIDTIKMGSLLIYNIINNDYSNNAIFTSEKTNNGLAKARYISNAVTLADGMDAEDLVVYIGAYWPQNTTILVYGKFLNAYDSEPFYNKAWTPLATTNVVRSSKVNDKDFNEYIFTLPTTAPSDQTAWLNTSNHTILRYTNSQGQILDTFKKFAIKIVLLSPDSSLVPRLTDLRAIATPSAT